MFPLPWGWCSLGATCDTRQLCAQTVTLKAPLTGRLAWRSPVVWQWCRRAGEADEFISADVKCDFELAKKIFLDSNKRETLVFSASLSVHNMRCMTARSGMQTSLYAQSDPRATTMAGGWCHSCCKQMAILQTQAMWAWSIATAYFLPWRLALSLQICTGGPWRSSALQLSAGIE